MAVQRSRQTETDWLVAPWGSEALYPCDSGDRLSICPPHIGCGYVREIPLRDDLSLLILDYTLAREVVWHDDTEGDRLEFEFQLAGLEPGYSFFVPYFGLQQFGIKPARQRFFKVEVFFKRPALSTYFHSFLERLSPATREIAERVLAAIARHRGGSALPTDERVGGRGRDRPCPRCEIGFEEAIAADLYSEAIALHYAARTPITPAMQGAIDNILNCPYRGAARRTDLERQALKLVELRLEAMVQPALEGADLECIYQAERLLRTQIVAPPSIESLARQVGTNRLKLNQGFHQLYGTTPFAYLRECRLHQARRLLVTSDLTVEEIAAAVGYSSRSRFATAFRRTFGVNPKGFQMRAWQRAG